MRMQAAGVAALAALAVSGCGGGGGSSQRLSRDEYVRQADAICAQILKEEKALPTPSSIDEIPAYVDKALPIADELIAKIEDLDPPATMEQGVKSWLDKTESSRSELTKLRSAAQGGDATKVREVATTGSRLDSERSSLARTIGLTTCANT